jgi:3-oxoacyl-[acyl-carrier-protein] synthase II
MRMSLEDSGLPPTAIGYVNAHGTSTQANDGSETSALKTVFGDHARKLPVSSTKSMTGHTLGAAGAVEAIICVLAMRDGMLPPTINLDTPSPDCDLDYVPNTARKAEFDHALSNSMGFGGHNVALVLSKWKDGAS